MRAGEVLLQYDLKGVITDDRLISTNGCEQFIEFDNMIIDHLANGIASESNIVRTRHDLSHTLIIDVPLQLQVPFTHLKQKLHDDGRIELGNLNRTILSKMIEWSS